MKLMGGLIVAVFFCVSLAAASDQLGATTQQLSSPTATASLSQLGILPSSSIQKDQNHRYASTAPDQVTCYDMRSYLVARESRDSDLTRVVGYRNCTSSSKFDVRLSANPSAVPAR